MELLNPQRLTPTLTPTQATCRERRWTLGGSNGRNQGTPEPARTATNADHRA